MTSENPDSNNNGNKKKNILTKIKKSFKKNDNDIFGSNAYEKLDTPRKDMIRGVLSLPGKNARDIMIPRVDIIAVDSNTELKPLVQVVYKAGHSRVPVFEDTIDNIVGILYVKDLLKLLIERPRKKFQLRKILHDPLFVPETMPLDELLLEFKKRKLHIAMVVDEYGGIGGIVTLEDILEEIVGEISDEYDSEELPELEQVGKNIYEVDSRMPISEFNEQLGLTLSNGDFDTIGGYVFDLFGKIPGKGETIKNGNISFTIKDISGTVINRITITLPKPR
jgi:CBS domain containing-hemolysin-like protein